ncbi:MAG: DUF2442 domain-containing protein [Bacteroidota bacterium]
MIPRPIHVHVEEKYKIHLRYLDGTTGELDLSHLAGKGIFKQWDENNLFSHVYIDSETHAIAWNEEIEICPDALYFKILNRTFKDWKEENLRAAH